MRTLIKHFYVRDGYRLVWGSQHFKLPIACMPKHLDLKLEFSANGPAKATWESNVFGETVKHERYLHEPKGRGFWLLVPTTIFEKL